MPIPKKEVRNGIEYNWNEYSPEEMPDYWLQNDRYINDAKLMNNGCVVVECNEQQAKEMAAHFVNNLCAIPTCTFYDGKKLSLCIDYAGRNSCSLKDKTNEYVSKYLGVS